MNSTVPFERSDDEVVDRLVRERDVAADEVVYDRLARRRGPGIEARCPVRARGRGPGSGRRSRCGSCPSAARRSPRACSRSRRATPASKRSVGRRRVGWRRTGSGGRVARRARSPSHVHAPRRSRPPTPRGCAPRRCPRCAGGTSRRAGCAKSQLNSAVRALPTWKKPVGEGANRTRGASNGSVLFDRDGPRRAAVDRLDELRRAATRPGGRRARRGSRRRGPRRLSAGSPCTPRCSRTGRSRRRPSSDLLAQAHDASQRRARLAAQSTSGCARRCSRSSPATNARSARIGASAKNSLP